MLSKTDGALEYIEYANKAAALLKAQDYEGAAREGSRALEMSGLSDVAQPPRPRHSIRSSREPRDEHVFRQLQELQGRLRSIE